MPPAITLDDYANKPPEQRSADFAGPLLDNGTAARSLSLLLLDLYALANRSGIGEFEYGFFRLLSRHLPFDAGWTGVTTHTANGPVMHNSFVYGLPGEFFTDWQRVRDCDPLAIGSMQRYGRSLAISIVEPCIDPRFRNWAIKYGLAQLMVVSALDHRFGLATFLSVYRRALDKPFSADEARALEDVIPHLSAALTISRSFQLTRERSQGAATPARAICDGFGAVHQADKAFDAILRGEWPTYRNSAGSHHLPTPLITHLHANTDQPYVGNTLTVTCSPVVGLFQIEARPRSALDRLSPRELSAIKLYGDGLSHKEVAQRMAISPATVRHYLRCAYKKLGMHDKSQIPWLLGLRENAADNTERG
ncbi:response regulator transcription factor [bacterium M00.F.Ca.ET.228.01.1.1]|uniref:helix-turn-helix transcriptional regulator n=1 Tax=Paraburkholderia phenoliruptrix TaxID=252970 RepID=UPI001092305A|nr:LuxR C-terminal-related transcriptional regulator [Paraburkholderia phenoliruptrix]TGP41575.1 response regulator transcription factor [bacterium M00.F.Ca.ET.228.01.1.1]TGR98233.1 response regulator transcription factor [bacterium M00.F.Ca.ET.191.01.1.1]TGU02423.1 response regulator transcription factor [bacterium M00.F.Ca.ET.155.01.1.1]MBW0447132.1 response regulator transcription factor [Paraburkholderia phenoliruptrix]MBW9101485.1 response regulator transcription factor [Paraburkholderia 